MNVEQLKRTAHYRIWVAFKDGNKRIRYSLEGAKGTQHKAMIMTRRLIDRYKGHYSTLIIYNNRTNAVCEKYVFDKLVEQHLNNF